MAIGPAILMICLLVMVTLIWCITVLLPESNGKNMLLLQRCYD